MPALLERQGGRQPAQPATHHGDQVIRREPAAPLPPPRRRRLARLVGWRCRGRPRGGVLLRPAAHGSQVAGTSCCPSAAPALPLPQSYS